MYNKALTEEEYREVDEFNHNEEAVEAQVNKIETYANEINDDNFTILETYEINILDNSSNSITDLEFKLLSLYAIKESYKKVKNSYYQSVKSEIEENLKWCKNKKIFYKGLKGFIISIILLFIIIKFKLPENISNIYTIPIMNYAPTVFGIILIILGIISLCFGFLFAYLGILFFFMFVLCYLVDIDFNALGSMISVFSVYLPNIILGIIIVVRCWKKDIFYMRHHYQAVIFSKKVEQASQNVKRLYKECNIYINRLIVEIEKIYKMYCVEDSLEYQILNKDLMITLDTFVDINSFLENVEDMYSAEDKDKFSKYLQDIITALKRQKYSDIAYLNLID
jgi:hypothetical protein